jgi:competence protein ComFC
VKPSPGVRIGGLVRLFELLFYPSACRICSKLLERPGERVVCGGCLATIGPETNPQCPLCGRFFEADVEPHPCSRCLGLSPPFSAHRSYGRYDGTLKDVILLIKYRNVSVLGRILAEHIARSPGSTEALWRGVDLVMPVPLHPKRRRERGFNQAEVLARGLAVRRDVPVATGNLVKISHTPPQTTLPAAAREGNVRGAYKVKKKGGIRGRVVLLVDDVFTTGATLAECSRTLRAAGADEVRALTVAQA